RIATVSISGQHELGRDELLAVIGVTSRSSLLFLDADAARGALMANPWVADAAVQKFYPGRLHIEIKERLPFALWQKDGKVHVIAADGTVLENAVAEKFAGLPFVVGTGAQRKAQEFLPLLEKFPGLREQVYASVFVAERRWNLKLKNGIEVKLPEFAA